MRKFLSLLMMMFASIALVLAQDPVEIASGTFNGKNATYTEGWTTTGTGVSRADCIIIGAGENITSPEVDLSQYESISVAIKARRYGTLSGSKAEIAVTFDGEAIGNAVASATSATTALDVIEYTVSDLSTGNFVFTCTNATSAGSSHGAGINSIVITGVLKSQGGEGGEGGEEATVNYYIVGTMTNWQVSEDYKLTANPDNEAEYMFTELALTTASQFKVVAVAGEEQTWYPDGQGNNYGENGEIVADGSYDVYFRPDGQGGDDWFYNVMYVAAHQEPQVDPVYGISGAWNNFDKQLFEVAADGETATFAVDLEAGEYEFKIRVDDDWLTKANNGQPYGLHREWNTIAVTDHADENLKLTADVNGVYVFTWTFASSEIAITFPAVHKMNAMWKVTEETAVAAEIEYINNYALAVTNPFATTLKPNVRTFEGYSFTHAIQVRNAAYPSEDAPAGTEQSGSTSLVITAKEDVEVAFFYNRQSTDNTTGAAAMNDNKDMKVFDQAAPTTALEGAFKVVWMQEDMKYVNAIKTMNLVKGHTYTVSAKGTTVQLHGIRYITDADEPEPAQPKFYVTGESLVESWEPNARPSYEDTYVFENLAAGEYVFKITVDGTWQTAKGFTDLTAPTPGVLPAETDDNIYFQLAEAGDVTITYDAENFTVTGNFYVAPVEEQPKYYLIGDSAFVVDAGATADKAWTPDAIPSNNDTTVLNLKAGQDYIMRLSLNGTWENHRDFRHLTDTAAGLIELPDEYGNHSIGFQLAEDGPVTIIYIPAAEEQPEVFKLIGNFYVAPAPDPTVAVMGSMNDWAAEIPFVLSDDKTYASLTVEHISADKYEFKFLINGDYRSNGYTYHRDYTGAANITGNDDNMKFIADQEGEYTFYWYFANDSAAIVYPEYVEPAKEYYAKYAPAWEWTKLTEAEGLWLTDTIVYGGIGVNINDAAADDNALFFSNEEIETARAIAGAEFAMNDTIVFSFNPADSVLTAIMIAKYVAPAEPDPTVVVYGSMTQPAWEVAIPFELAQDKQSATLFNDNIKAGSYAFKLQVNGAWRSNGATFNRENAAAANITENNDANMTFVADQEGEYTFVWFFENDSLAIIYPEYVEPATPKFYVTGNDALVGEELAWHADAIPSLNDTLELDLQAGVTYLLKVTLNGTWQGENNVKGYNELTEKPEQLSDVGNDHNIGFQLAEAGKVQVVYIAAAEGQTEVFKLMGNFYQSETPVEHTYTVAGNSLAAFGAEWSPKQADNDMVLQEDGTYKWEKAGIELPAGHIEFKVCEDHGWDVSYPASNYVLNIAEVGTYTITITFNPAAATEKVAAEAVKTGSAEVDPTASIKGGWDNWAEETAFQLAEDKLSASAALNLEAGEYTFKMILNGGDWRSNGYTYHREYTSCVGITGNTQADMVLQADVAGQYVITWTFANDSINIAFPELPVEFTCNWDEIAWLGGSNDQIKVCKESDAISVVNVQNPHWSEATEDGIYMTFPSAAWGEISLPEGKYETQGAGMLVFLSALTQEYNEISIVCQDVEYIINVYNADNMPKPAFYLVGNFNEWTAAEAYKFALNPNNDAEYVLTATLAENDSLKVIRVMEGEETVWYPADAENYVVDAAHAGEKDIYFRPDYQGGEDWYAQCIYVAENAPQGCDWDHIDFIGSAVPELADQFKLCKEGQYPSVINIQNSFGTEAGIYVTFPSAAFGEISMTEGTYAIQGAGMLLYCSAFTDVETEVSIVCDGNPIIFTVYNAEGSAPVVDPTVAVMGSMNDWAAEIPFALSDDKTYASLTVENIGADEYEFKFIINGEWRSNGYRYHRDFPGAAGITENNDANMVFVADQDGEYTFTWFFANDSLAITYPEKQEPVYVLTNGYYLVGTMNEWTPAAENLFALNPDNEFEYQLAINLDVNTEIKVVYVENDAIVTWYPAEGENYVIDDHHNGATTVYFRPDGQGGEDWYNGVIYVVPTSTVDITNVDANAPAVKVLHNGQLLIIKGSKTFNVQGQLVK